MEESARRSRRNQGLLLWGWGAYFAAYVLTERLIPADRCYPVHIPLDDLIPFHEIFLIPYVFWYFLIAGSLLYFLFRDAESFRRLQLYILAAQFIATVCYILLPTRQDLRPAVFPRDNLLTRGVELLYRLDTNTGVCPSLHVALSLAVASVWWKTGIRRVWKVGFGVAAGLICLSTVFLKQHSAADFFAALPVCLIAEMVACGDWWKKNTQKSLEKLRKFG